MPDEAILSIERKIA